MNFVSKGIGVPFAAVNTICSSDRDFFKIEQGTTQISAPVSIRNF